MKAEHEGIARKLVAEGYDRSEVMEAYDRVAGLYELARHSAADSARFLELDMRIHLHIQKEGYPGAD